MARKLLDILPALGLELGEQFDRAPNAFGKGGIGHCSGNLDVSALVAEVEHFPANDDLGNVLAVVGLALHFTLPLTEQREIEPGIVKKRNPVTVSSGLTRCALDWNDLTGPATPLSGDNCGTGKSGKEMVRTDGEVLDLASGIDLDTNDRSVHPVANRFFDKSDWSSHVPHSPYATERGWLWGWLTARKVNSLILNRLCPPCVAVVA